MKQKELFIILFTLLSLIYLASYYWISKMEDTVLDIPDYSINNLMRQLVKYKFKGKWEDTSGGFRRMFPNFTNDYGNAVMLLRHGEDIGLFDEQGLQYYSFFILPLLLSDGDSRDIKSILKFRFSSVNEQTHNATGKFKSKENPFSFELTAKKSCEFDFELNVNDINFKTTRKLKDLSFIVNVSSAGENCQMAFTSKLIFNDSLRKETWNYLIFASLITIFDLLVILLVIVRFEGHDHVCNSQSVIFWTGIGMLNCLFCFVNISFITVEFSKITYFLVIAIANFVNFSLIVLRVLHKIGRVQLSALLNDEVS